MLLPHGIWNSILNHTFCMGSDLLKELQSRYGGVGHRHFGQSRYIPVHNEHSGHHHFSGLSTALPLAPGWVPVCKHCSCGQFGHCHMDLEYGASNRVCSYNTVLDGRHQVSDVQPGLLNCPPISPVS
ncbi:unnamed protein product [Meganyctiphanes norvegica]|uniref:Uncharacterized protein n=1 Tax=Meganyctiphanes norvegica TaxID=48144 RepID=A0AAV2QKG3_MEGNR